MPDIELVCQDCHAAFAFTEAEQQFFQTQGFVQTPKRCKACRAARRQGGGRNRPGPRRPEGAPGSGAGERRPRPAHYRPIVSHVAGDAPPAAHRTTHGESDAVADVVAPPPRTDAPRAPRPPRGPMHATLCSACGERTEVPFVPDGQRPVFCLPCLKKQTR